MKAILLPADKFLGPRGTLSKRAECLQFIELLRNTLSPQVIVTLMYKIVVYTV